VILRHVVPGYYTVSFPMVIRPSGVNPTEGILVHTMAGANV